VEDLCVDLKEGDHRRRVVDNVSFSFDKGDYFALVGESGSGKSVTCQSIMRLLPPDLSVQGTVFVGDQSVYDLSPADLRAFRRRSVGMIFQDPLAALNPVRTIGSQMIETLALHHPDESRSALADRAVAALKSVKVPKAESRLSAYPFQLSGGLNQRVMIALALMGHPDLLIADEPTTALDMSVQADILDLVDELRTELGIGVLLVTHDLGIVEDRASHIAVMQSGRLIEAGPTEVLISAPRESYTQRLFEASRIRERPPGSFERAQPETCLSFENVSKRFHVKGVKGDGIVAADKISFDVKAGEIVALVGESGSGKTTAAKMAIGMLRADSGTIAVGGQPITGMPVPGIQLVFQHPKDTLDPLMRVDAQFHEVLKFAGVRDRKERDSLIRQALADVGLGEQTLSRRPTNLSGGEAQRAVIARALLLKPKVLIADEPLSAVDVCLQKLILDCFTSLRDRLGLGILLITHDLRIVLEIADRVIVLKDGERVEEFTVAEFNAPGRAPYTRRLIDAMPGTRQSA
jgi:peptide/nickel transport system ATP-binding protein